MTIKDLIVVLFISVLFLTGSDIIIVFTLLGMDESDYSDPPSFMDIDTDFDLEGYYASPSPPPYSPFTAQSPTTSSAAEERQQNIIDQLLDCQESLAQREEEIASLEQRLEDCEENLRGYGEEEIVQGVETVEEEEVREQCSEYPRVFAKKTPVGLFIYSGDTTDEEDLVYYHPRVFFKKRYTEPRVLFLDAWSGVEPLGQIGPARPMDYMADRLWGRFTTNLSIQDATIQGLYEFCRDQILTQFRTLKSGECGSTVIFSVSLEFQDISQPDLDKLIGIVATEVMTVDNDMEEEQYETAVQGYLLALLIACRARYLGFDMLSAERRMRDIFLRDAPGQGFLETFGNDLNNAVNTIHELILSNPLPHIIEVATEEEKDVVIHTAAEVTRVWTGMVDVETDEGILMAEFSDPASVQEVDSADVGALIHIRFQTSILHSEKPNKGRQRKGGLSTQERLRRKRLEQQLLADEDILEDIATYGLLPPEDEEDLFPPETIEEELEPLFDDPDLEFPDLDLDPDNLFGGCVDVLDTLPLALMRKKDLYCPVSRNYNCLISCLACFDVDAVSAVVPRPASREGKEFNEIADGVWVEQVRKTFSNTTESPISLPMARTLLEGAGIHPTVYCFEKRDGFFYWLQGPDKPPFLIHYNSHWYLALKKSILTYKRCPTCSQWRQSANVKTYQKHLDNCVRCIECRSAYMKGSQHKCRGTRNIEQPNQLRAYAEPLAFTALRNVQVADFETFQTTDKGMVVYSVSWLDLPEQISKNPNSNDQLYLDNIEPNFLLGPRALDVYMRRLITTFHGTVVFYNGAGFDFLFCMRWLVKNNIPIKSWLKNGGRILSIQVKNITFWDICLFTFCSLKQACRSYGVLKKYCKTTFDHRLIKNWDDAGRYAYEIRDYNNMDVKALASVYVNYAREVWRSNHTNVNDTVTLSQMCFQLWTRMLPPKTTLIVPNFTQHTWFKRGLYGGRVGPQRRQFSSYWASALWDQIDGETNKWRTDVDLHYHRMESKSYEKLGDIVSLYPWAMQRYQYPCGRFKERSLDERESGNLIRQLELWDWSYYEDEWDNLQAGVWGRRYIEVDVECPDNLICCYLPERIGGKLFYSLYPKKNQVYFGPEILFAVHKLGYRVTRIHKMVEFEKERYLFKEYVDTFFHMKKNAVKDTPRYANAKLCMNSLSGKVSQNPDNRDFHICYDENQILKYTRNEKLTTHSINWVFDLDDPDVAVAVTVETSEKEVRPTKPIYLGVAILARARIHMAMILSLFPGSPWTRCSDSFAYTDTDSIVMNGEAWEEAKRNHPQHFGKALGQLDDELDGGRIIRSIRTAPKTYWIEFINEEGIFWKTRCKGIKHTGSFCNAAEVIEKDYDYNCLTLEERAEQHDPLQSSYYYILNEDGSTDGDDTRLYTFLGADCFQAMVNQQQVCARFGMMKKQYFKGGAITRIDLLDRSLRVVNKKDWWSNGTRKIIGDGSVPMGHFMYIADQ